MNWLKENWFKFGLLFVISIIAVSIFYYYVVFLPAQQEKNQQIEEKERLLSESQKYALDECLSSVDWQYLSIFERMSRVMYPERWENIPLSITLNSVMGDTNEEKEHNIELWRDARDECFKKYPQK